MTKVKELLSDIVSRAKEVLARDPENKAALCQRRLAVAEKRVLQDEYFAHAERAWTASAASSNAAALGEQGRARRKGQGLKSRKMPREKLTFRSTRIF